MKKLLCFVLTTAKYEDRINRIKNTWGNHIDTIFYSDHYDLSRNIIMVYDKTDYASAAIKQINIVNVLPELKKDNVKLLDKYDWILFCDDDTFINFKVALNEIEYFNEECTYGNIFNQEKHPENPIHKDPNIPKNFEYFSGGAGFFLSTRLIKKMGKLKYYGNIYGDVEIGLNLHYKKINLIQHPLMNSFEPFRYNHSPSDIKQSLSYHYIKSDQDMNELYSISTS